MATERTADRITVSWREPDSEQDIIGYELRWRSGSEAWNEVLDIDRSEMSYQIGGLQAGTRYEVQVRAVSVNGAGEWSARLEQSTVAEGLTKPPAPSGPTASSVTANSAQITWSAPHTDLAITKYVVQWIVAPRSNAVGLGNELSRQGSGIRPRAARPAAQVDWAGAESAETDDETPSITLDGLAPDTTYLVRVRAATDQIDGEWSAPLEVQTLGEGGNGNGNGNVNVLPAPSGLKAEATGETSVKVTWTLREPPAGFTRTGHTVQWREAGVADWQNAQSASVGPDITEYSISGLATATSYDVRVQTVGSSDGLEVRSTWAHAQETTDQMVVRRTPTFDWRATDTPIPKSFGAVHFVAQADEPLTHNIDLIVNVRSRNIELSSGEGTRTITLAKGATQAPITARWDSNQATSRDGWVQARFVSSPEYNIATANALRRTTIDHDA